MKIRMMIHVIGIKQSTFSDNFYSVYYLHTEGMIVEQIRTKEWLIKFRKTLKDGLLTL